MQLVENHIVKKGHKFYNECDELCFKAKNLYNAANYIIRKAFIEVEEKDRTYIPYVTMDKLIKNMDFGKHKNPYRELKATPAQQVLRRLDQDWRNFFAAIKDWSKNKHKYKGMPGPPKYKHKVKGRAQVVYPKITLSKMAFEKEKVFHLSGSNIKIKPYKANLENVNQVVITPKNGFLSSGLFILCKILLCLKFLRKSFQ